MCLDANVWWYSHGLRKANASEKPPVPCFCGCCTSMDSCASKNVTGYSVFAAPDLNILKADIFVKNIF